MADALALYEALLEQGPCCVLVVDEARNIFRAHGDTSVLFHSPAASLAGRPFDEAIPAYANAQWRERFDRGFRGEYFLVREDVDQTVWFLDFNPVRLDGAIPYVSIFGRDITQMVIAERDLRNTVLTAVTASEYERRTIAKFLHDKVGQNLTALGLQLEVVRMDLEPGCAPQSARIGETQDLLEAMMEEVREYSHALNPSAVERSGLRSALDRLAARAQIRIEGVARVNMNPSLKLEPRVAFAMYQIAQEAVENAVRHAGCSIIEITVKSTKLGVYLEIRDNGKGFDPGSVLADGAGWAFSPWNITLRRRGWIFKFPAAGARAPRFAQALPGQFRLCSSQSF